MKTLSAQADQQLQQLQRANPSTNRQIDKSTTLGKLSECMDELAYDVLVDMVAWANLLDDLYNHRVDAEGLTDVRLSVMMRPFSGFGPVVQAWGIYAPAVTPILSNEIAQWYSDKEYRKANSITWLVLSKVGMALAQATKGWQMAEQVTQVLQQGFKQ